MTQYFWSKKKKKKGTELKSKLSGTPAKGTNTHPLPDEQNAVYPSFGWRDIKWE